MKLLEESFAHYRLFVTFIRLIWGENASLVFFFPQFLPYNFTLSYLTRIKQ